MRKIKVKTQSKTFTKNYDLHSGIENYTTQYLTFKYLKKLLFELETKTFLDYFGILFNDSGKITKTSYSMMGSTSRYLSR